MISIAVHNCRTIYNITFLNGHFVLIFIYTVFYILLRAAYTHVCLAFDFSWFNIIKNIK